MDRGTEMMAAARELAVHVWPVFPVRNEGQDKKPVAAGWRERASRTVNGDPDWTRATGVGVLPGPGTFFVVDVDRKDGKRGDETLAIWEKEHGSFPKTWTVITGSGGWHYYFKHPGFTVKGSRGAIGEGIDVIGEEGSPWFAVAPPSLHPNGKTYEWVPGLSPKDLPLAEAPSWLLDMIKPATVPRLVHSAPAESDILHRASLYLATIEGAVSGSHGHDQTFYAAMKVVRGFALSEEDAFALIWAEYNPRCVPPWSEKELRHKVRSALKDGRIEWGCLRDRPLPAGRPPPRRQDEPDEAPSDVQIEEGPLGKPVADLLREDIPPPKWIVPGRIQAQTIALIAGPPGVGKTFLAYDWITQAVKAGASVYVCQNEGGKKAMQTRLARACAAAGIDNPPPTFRYDRNTLLPLADRKTVERFAKRLHGYDMIVMDSMASLWPGLDESDSGQMSMVAENLKIMCEYSGATPTGLHHTIKSSWKPGEAPTLADIRGHGAMHGRIDTAFILKPLKRMAGVVRFELYTVKQRDQDEPPGCEMEILMEGPAAIVTPIQPSGPQLSLAEQRLIALEPKVLALIPEPPADPTTRETLQDQLGKRASDVRAVVARLVDGGKVKELSRKRLIRVAAPRNERYSE